MIRGSHYGCPHWQSDRSPDIPTRKISVSQTPVFINGERIFDWERQGNKWRKCLHLCLHSACTKISGNRQVLAPMGIMLSPMPALVGIMLAPCCHFCLSAVFHSGRYAVMGWRLFSSVGKRNRTTGTDAVKGMTNARLDKPSESPRVFGLTKTLGGYHYRQSRNDNRTPPRSHQPKGKSET